MPSCSAITLRSGPAVSFAAVSGGSPPSSSRTSDPRNWGGWHHIQSVQKLRWHQLGVSGAELGEDVTELVGQHCIGGIQPDNGKQPSRPCVERKCDEIRPITLEHLQDTEDVPRPPSGVPLSSGLVHRPG